MTMEAEIWHHANASQEIPKNTNDLEGGLKEILHLSPKEETQSLILDLKSLELRE